MKAMTIGRMPATTVFLLAWLACSGVQASTGAGATNAGPAARPHATLDAFASEAEFQDLLAQWHRQTAEYRRKRREMLARQAAPNPPAPAPATASAAGESITNVQTAGVDEGGIIKRHGDHLVILRRGRLFTVRIGDDSLQPVAMVDAFAPGIEPGHSWYDEMLVSGDTVVVVGFSYARGGTEIGLFDIDARGGLAHRSTWHLRSNDYYSSRNYASRLLGDRLVFYAPMHLDVMNLQSDRFHPALRRWHAGVEAADFKRILPATRIHRTDDELDPLTGVTLHTVTTCDLGREPMQCESSAVLGPPGRTFYMSADAVYVWTTRPARQVGTPNTAAIFRFPLDGTAPSALKASGSPIDQLSFLEDGGGHLNVLVRSHGRGEGMWNAERQQGEFALLRVPVREFGDGTTSAPASAYRPLPEADAYQAHNRFVGDWLLYGAAPWPYQTGAGAEPGPAYAVRYASPAAPVATLEPGHAVERIEAMGNDAILVGSAGSNLHFTSVRLGEAAATSGTWVQAGAKQGESRSHGFFYRADGPRQGIVGLPVLGPPRNPGNRYARPAAVAYLRNDGLRLDPLGQLDAGAPNAAGDGCRVSCMDWYGDARPVFIGERIFALLGYELVEGRLDGDAIREVRRANFSPAVDIAR